MPIRSASDALVHLQATMQDKSPALIREALTNPKSEFLEWVQQESKELRDIVEKTLDHVLTEQSPRVRFQDFYNLFLAMEEMGNALTDTRDFGTALSKHILTAQGVDKDTMEQFLDVVNLDKRQQFESSVVRAIPSQLSLHDDDSGVRHFVSGLSVAQLSPSTCIVQRHGRTSYSNVVLYSIRVHTACKPLILLNVSASGHAHASHLFTMPAAWHRVRQNVRKIRSLAPGGPFSANFHK